MVLVDYRIYGELISKRKFYNIFYYKYNVISSVTKRGEYQLFYDATSVETKL